MDFSKSLSSKVIVVRAIPVSTKMYNFYNRTENSYNFIHLELFIS